MRGFIAGTCGTGDTAHTRVGSCAMFEGTPSGLVLHDKNVSFSTDADTFNQEILDAMSAMGAQRAYPIMEGIVDLQLAGGDVRTQQEGFGAEQPNGINPPHETWVITSGGICLFKQLMKLRRRQFRVFKIDDANSIYGTLAEVNAGAGDTETRFRGFLAQIYISRRINNGTTPGAILIDIFYDAKYENEEQDMQSLPLTASLDGLTGLVLKAGSAASKAKVVIACSGDDVTSMYGDKLADVTLYERKDGAAITAVAYSDGEIVFTPATAGGAYKIKTADVLEAADVLGAEGENEYITLP